ncbi:MAG: GGDEF domain-containing protein [Clostridiales bacterium]|nr:GGDEF domain-containing protein [Clostridiales bacterium]
MELDYTTFYIEANIVCIIIFLMMFIREMGSVGRQAKQMVFVNITIAHMLYFICDTTWVLVISDVIPKNFYTASTVNVINAILLSAITGFWFVYVELSQGEKYIAQFKHRMNVLTLAMLETVIILVLFVFFPRVVINENYEMTTAYYVVFISIPAIYIIISSVRAFIRAFRKENYAVRRQYVVCGAYPVIITIFGIVQVAWLNAPVFCFGSTIMMLYVYIVSLNDQVSIDELTHLNNRTQLKKYIVSESSRANADKTVYYILMIDLNKFKQINDQYGHVEGDRALIRTADALKLACADNPLKTFIARYGGDEFIIISKTDNESLIRELCGRIKDTLFKLNDEAHAEYELSASIGYASYSGDVRKFQEALSLADEALYKEKALRGPS